MRKSAGLVVSVALACFCLLMIPLSGQATSPALNAAMNREFEAAMAAQDAGDFKQAESLLRALRAKHPGIFAVDESLGILYATEGKYAEALPLFSAAAREMPSSDVAHANLGAALFKLHRNRQALDEFQIAAKINPKNADTQQSLGQLWMEANQPALAASAYEAALRLRPEDGDLIISCAQTLMASGKTEQAQKLILGWKGASESATAQSILGDSAEKAGNYRQAAEYYSRAVQLEPSEPNVWALGVEFLRHWTFDAAIREFQSGVTQFPSSVRLQLGLGAAYFGNANYSLSTPIFSDLLKQAPENSFYAELLGMSCTAATQTDTTHCGILPSYAQSHPGDVAASVYAAVDLLQGGRTPDEVQLARKLLRHAIEVDPKSSDARVQMALLQQSQGKWAESIPNLEAAIAIRASLAEAHYRLALAYWRCGRKDEARAQIALQKKYSEQQQSDLDQRLSKITTFLVKIRN